MNGVKYEVVGENKNIGLITLNRPQALNAMNTETVNELRDLLAEIDKDEQIRCLILTGEGRAFWFWRRYQRRVSDNRNYRV